MGERQNNFTAFVDPKYNEAERRQIGVEIINYIIDRTKNGEGINNASFKGKYSKAYVKTSEFSIAGKTPGDVNLTLTGDMLDSMEVVETSTGRIKIGFKAGFENDKSVWLERKGYRFLGLSDKELSSILNDFGPPGAELEPADIDENLVEGFIRNIRGR